MYYIQTKKSFLFLFEYEILVVQCFKLLRGGCFPMNDHISTIDDPEYFIKFSISELNRIQELILQNNEDGISFTDYMILERIRMYLSYDPS